MTGSVPGWSRAGVAACAAALLASGAAVPPTASGEGGDTVREAAALTGTATLYRSAGDDITFAFDVHLAAVDNGDPRKATGTFRFAHHADDFGGRAEARADCLMTGGSVAVVTGVVTDTDVPGVLGTRIGVTVHDLPSGDRLGYSWALDGSPAHQTAHLPLCLGSAPFERVRADTGDFVVLPWRPPL